MKLALDKLERWGYRWWKFHDPNFNCFCIHPCDRQTDGQMDGRATAYTRYSIYAVARKTRSQAVARIADRTASQQFWGSRGIGHVTIWQSICHFLLVVLWNGVSKSSRFRDIVL